MTTFSPTNPIPSEITSVSFSFLSSADVRKISVKQIVNPVLLDNLNRPTEGGLYDLALGCFGRGDICATCHLPSFSCPGHYGHIELPQPVFHPLFMTNLYVLLRGTCLFCHKFLISEIQVIRYTTILSLLERGLLLAATQVDDIISKITTSTSPQKPTKPSRSEPEADKGESTNEPGGEDGEEGDVQAEVKNEIMKALAQHAASAIANALRESSGGEGSAVSRDGYKVQAAYERRKRVIAEFFKAISRKRCARCGAIAHRLRKEGHTKIIEFSLTQKQKDMHQAMGVRRKAIHALQSLAGKTLPVAPSPYSDSARETRERGVMQLEDEGYDDRSLDSDQESGDGKARRGKAVTPDTDDEDEGRTESEGEGEDLDPMDLNVDEVAGTVEDVESGGISGKAGKDGGKQKQTERVMMPSEVRSHIRLLFHNESRICSLIFSPHGPTHTSKRTAAGAGSLHHVERADPDMFFMEVVPVTPTKFRPASIMGDSTFENSQNTLLSAILQATFRIRDLNNAVISAKQMAKEKDALSKGVGSADVSRLTVQLLESLLGLQVAVNSMMDSGKNPMVVRQGKLPPQGVKQVLEKKEGLFRKNMMGKRVNYAARSVISPDVNIETNEIGVPPVFARKLTFPEPVTPHNIAQMKQAVINGPHKHPGADFIEMENGQLISLERMSEEQRIAQANQLLASESKKPALHSSSTSGVASRPDVGIPFTRTPQINKKVYRHLNDGDILILNRQPTLHKPSMMCHRAKVLKGEKTIRMHYANCNSYNADFDGDEMNMHFPQTVIAQAEARQIANTDNQYLVPTSGNPIRGLIQDHIVAGVWMCNKDTFFTREEYYQLIYGALRPEGAYTGGGSVITLPPAVWKPRPRWTGKQIISTIMKNVTPDNSEGLNLTSDSKVKGKAWGEDHKSEGTVLFVDGELLTGIVDKSQYGDYGLVHATYELYGASVAGKLLSVFSRLFTKYLQHSAFTCRMDDLILKDEGEVIRSKILRKAPQKGLEAHLDYVGLDPKDTSPDNLRNMRIRLEEVLRDDAKMAGLDARMKRETSKLTTAVNDRCMPSGLLKPFPWNNMQTMTSSGAKGSNVNANQISCLLGQQELEGRRVPVMISGKSLPSFKAFETHPRAGGYVAQRFLTGYRPQEYYFHCMAGREGLIDTAVKTSRSGYLQRCLIKHLEGIRVHYDHSVRNSDGSVVQFHYGEDSLDVTKQKHLFQFDFSVRNFLSLINRYEPRSVMGKVNENLAIEHMKTALKHVKKSAKRAGGSGKAASGEVPPSMSIYSPSTHIGSMSEKYAEALEEYIKKNPAKLLLSKKKVRADWPEFIKSDQLLSIEKFRSLMQIRFMRSLVDPGEAVGLLASQGVGEPSTQMTLNTFHLAGHGATNVTLGIPRLRELVMTASATIKTPTMRLPVTDGIPTEQLKKFCKDHSRLTVSQVVDEVAVNERLTPKTAENGYSRQKIYSVRLQFFPREEYQKEYNVSPEEILVGIQKTFVPLLDKEISKEFKQYAKDLANQASNIGKGKAVANTSRSSGATEGENEDERDLVPRRGADVEDDGERDADDAKQASKARRDDPSYDEDDDDDQVPIPGAEDYDLDAMEKAFAIRDGESDEDEEDEDEDGDGDGADMEVDGKGDSKRKLKKKEKQAREKRMAKVESNIAKNSKFVQKLTFDKNDGEWCEFELEFSSTSPKLLLVGIVERCCRAAVVSEVSGISRCIIAEAENNRDKEVTIATDGSNLKAVWNFGEGVIKLDNIYSNDIAEILRTYGVEAARSAIIKEMSGVFGVYGIAVNYRHLTIIADYMTSEGGYKAFNRTGIATSPSPLLKSSYETTANFIADATLYGDFDDCSSPSARIVIGRPPQSGTGVFDVCVEMPSSQAVVS